MRKRKAARLTAGEMEILHVLWRQGPTTLAEAQAGLGREIGYTTVQTRLNRLVDKRLATRTSERPARYVAAVAREEVSARHLDLLMDKVSGGSVVPLVAHLVRDRQLSAEEILELKKLIALAEQRGRKGKDAKR